MKSSRHVSSDEKIIFGVLVNFAVWMMIPTIENMIWCRDDSSYIMYIRKYY